MTEVSEHSSVRAVQPLGVRLALPSIADLIFVALLGVLVFTPLSVRLLGDAGIGWHMRTGQWILNNHAIPHVDTFSSTMQGQPWFAWEWLYDLAVGWMEQTGGLNAVVAFNAAIIALIFAGTFRLLVRRGTDVLLAVALVLLAASASMIHFFARPHVVSWLFTIVWFAILERTENDAANEGATSPRHLLWWLLPIMLLWVNVHGGFLIGFALVAIYLASAAWRWAGTRENRFDDFLEKFAAAKRAKELAVVGSVAALATLVNPYGLKLHVHIYRYLTNNFLMDHIDEFQSPNFHRVAQKCFAVLLLLTLAALAARGRDTRLRELLVVLFAMYAGLYAARNIPVSSILLVLVIGPWLSPVLQRLANSDFTARMGSVEKNLRGHLWPAVAVVFVIWIVAQGGRLGSQTVMSAHFDPKRFPASAVDYMKTSGLRQPVLSPDYWGGYLIYRMYPENLVADDDRHDLYGEKFLKSYLKMVRAEPGWDELLQQYQIRCALVPKESALANLLHENRKWKSIYSDEVAILFVRQ